MYGLRGNRNETGLWDCAGCGGLPVGGAPGLMAQAQNGNGSPGSGDAGQKKTNGANQQNGQQGAQPKPQPAGNPFPEDTNSVPVMPSKVTPDEYRETSARRRGFLLPEMMRTRFGALMGRATCGRECARPGIEFSHEQPRRAVLPKPGDDDTDSRGKKRSNALDEAPKETPQQDISVGKYYLDNKNWRAALSRFQSALVLAPDEPDVYWGLAESQRHMGDFCRSAFELSKSD